MHAVDQRGNFFWPIAPFRAKLCLDGARQRYQDETAQKSTQFFSHRFEPLLPTIPHLTADKNETPDRSSDIALLARREMSYSL
jgi:hypothetical protein